MTYLKNDIIVIEERHNIKFESVIYSFTNFYDIDTTDDYCIAMEIGVPLEIYTTHLKNNFNGFQYFGKIYFKDRQDALDALEWIDSLIVASLFKK